MRAAALWMLFMLVSSFTVAAEPFREIAGDISQFEALPDVQPAATDWPWWRGPKLDGIAPASKPPLEFGPTQHVKWKVSVPGRGHASPILWGQRIFIATADEVSQESLLLAYDRASGRELWKTELHRGGFMKKVHRRNSHASSTPVCDGERVFVCFIHLERLWLSATDLNGKLLWQKDVGPYDAIYGYGPAPAIYQNTVIVCADNDQTQSAFMAAVHRRTGEIMWRVRRLDVDTYATPIVPRVAGRDQLLLGGGGWLMSYSPTTGRELWKCAGPTAETTANTVAFSTDRVFVSGGYPKPYALMSVKADGSGDVTQTHVNWRTERGMPYVPSPLYHNGLLYIVDDNGIATCTDSSSGKPVWQKRLGGDFSASVVLCGDRLYAASEQGIIHVLKIGRQYEELARNDLKDEIMATPIILNDKIYVRTKSQLFCFGE